jgi:hypothetical protein
MNQVLVSDIITEKKDNIRRLKPFYVLKGLEDFVCGLLPGSA